MNVVSGIREYFQRLKSPRKVVELRPFGHFVLVSEPLTLDIPEALRIIEDWEPSDVRHVSPAMIKSFGKIIPTVFLFAYESPNELGAVEDGMTMVISERGLHTGMAELAGIPKADHMRPRTYYEVPAAALRKKGVLVNLEDILK